MRGWILLIGALLTGCVPMSAHQELKQKNAVLEEEVQRDKAIAKDGSDRNVSLALQNHSLKIDNAALLKEGRERDKFYDSVTDHLRQQVGEGRLKITRYKEMLTLEVADEILFDSGKAGLKVEGREVLREVAQAVAKSDKTIRVVGHTDNQALGKGAAFASNWELSTARATTVVRFLQDACGLDPRRLLAAGRGEWMPVASNNNAEGRQRNRRISITLIDRGLLDGSEGALP